MLRLLVPVVLALLRISSILAFPCCSQSNIITLSTATSFTIPIGGAHDVPIFTTGASSTTLLKATNNNNNNPFDRLESFFQNIIISKDSKRMIPNKASKEQIQMENELLQAIAENNSRLSNDTLIPTMIEALEKKAIESSSWSIPQPAISSKVLGRWKLMYTNNANTASPIQRKAVDASKFDIYQDILLREYDEGKTQPQQRLVVSQVVQFGPNFRLEVDALASTRLYPLEELTERERDGKIFGLNLLGVSKIGEEAKEDESRPDSRINFVFDEGNFIWNRVESSSVWKIPYPVPFRSPLFRDAVKGWIDITYLSDRIRISRGNKGTTFVLVREE